ncbi:hypothetical protein [Azospirillum sp. TSH64]|uniref:hypothetical protein n=1 Tax=Azospirillum sp. TSH64 TaxID=652740 RepID=UPI000D61FC89|nr:hypothetical protein [Azospirillum sp. TSH64]PWC81283.1 hypothetical protein TSH64_01195 [Azospirillum sp. TSH64]
MKNASLDLVGGSAAAPSRPSDLAEIRFSICKGANPRVSIGVAKEIVDAMPSTPRRADLEVDGEGLVCLRFDPEGRFSVISSEGSNFYWIQFGTDAAPWPCTSEKRGAHTVGAVVRGLEVVSTAPIPESFYVGGKRPAPIASIEEIRARVLWLNEQISARRFRGMTIEPVVRDGEIRLRVVEEVVL